MARLSQMSQIFSFPPQNKSIKENFFEISVGRQTIGRIFLFSVFQFFLFLFSFKKKL